MNQRKWQRGASLLGSDLEAVVAEELRRRFPQNIPVDIQIVGNQGSSAVTAQVTNFEQGIEVIERACPEDFMGSSCPKLDAAIHAADRAIATLRSTGKLNDTI